MIQISASERLRQVTANVAQTILRQLGGNKFVAMIGAKNLVSSADGLHFSIGKGAKNKANKVAIKLAADDTYTIEFYNLRGVNLKDISKVYGVHADELQKVFTQETGFDTHL